jgi:hypothetical protein
MPSSITTVLLKTWVPKFSPVTVREFMPVSGAFIMLPDATAASNVKAIDLVPAIAPTVS